MKSKKCCYLGFNFINGFLERFARRSQQKAIYDELIKNALQDKDVNSRLKKLKPIKKLLEADYQQQLTKTINKGATVVSDAATLLNAYNYQQFAILMTKLEQDGHFN